MEEGLWEILNIDNDYEINTAFPYPIRRTSTGNIISEYLNSEYMKVNLNRVTRRKHRVIALQWILNDDPDVKTQVDHIDQNKLNNHITNLRWATPSENSKNKTFKGKRKLEYIYELPEEAIQITEFDGIILDRYYFDPESEQILLRTKTKQVKYQIVHPSLNHNCLRIRLNDVDGRGLNEVIQK
jgi:DNA-directed RNA polymerase subunit L